MPDARLGRPVAPEPAGTGERIAKLLARAGVGSRREVERMIAEGRVAIAGKRVTTPALRLPDLSGVTVDGRPAPQPEPPRLWRLHKPRGVLVTRRDPEGRRTLADLLPAELRALKPVGRLDINSEGLLLLTNDGELKRLLELPASGLARSYRVRVHGPLDEERLAPLRVGLVLGRERFRPMMIAHERSGRSNHWLVVTLREGRNREIRRAFAAVGLEVNRLIRVAYGPVALGSLAPGEIEEVPQKTLLALLESVPGAERIRTALLDARGWSPERWARPRPAKPGKKGRRRHKTRAAGESRS
ncbi:MAG: rRNA pseudouridine synthase [Alphaproteobacteria bacterium]|nr:MAG: rRNA pseudouridine synthase [Alphaproteobacteria bacterium]